MHLHRRAVRTGKPGDVFVIALVARCEANLKGTIDDRTPQVEQRREEILSEFTVALAEDAMQGGNDMDYFECMFTAPSPLCASTCTTTMSVFCPTAIRLRSGSSCRIWTSCLHRLKAPRS